MKIDFKKYQYIYNNFNISPYILNNQINKKNNSALFFLFILTQEYLKYNKSISNKEFFSNFMFSKNYINLKEDKQIIIQKISKEYEIYLTNTDKYFCLNNNENYISKENYYKFLIKDNNYKKLEFAEIYDTFLKSYFHTIVLLTKNTKKIPIDFIKEIIKIKEIRHFKPPVVLEYCKLLLVIDINDNNTIENSYLYNFVKGLKNGFNYHMGYEDNHLIDELIKSVANEALIHNKDYLLNNFTNYNLTKIQENEQIKNKSINYLKKIIEDYYWPTNLTSKNQMRKTLNNYIKYLKYKKIRDIKYINIKEYKEDYANIKKRIALPSSKKIEYLNIDSLDEYLQQIIYQDIQKYHSIDKIYDLYLLNKIKLTQTNYSLILENKLNFLFDQYYNLAAIINNIFKSNFNNKENYYLVNFIKTHKIFNFSFEENKKFLDINIINKEEIILNFIKNKISILNKGEKITNNLSKEIIKEFFIKIIYNNIKDNKSVLDTLSDINNNLSVKTNFVSYIIVNIEHNLLNRDINKKLIDNQIYTSKINKI